MNLLRNAKLFKKKKEKPKVKPKKGKMGKLGS